MTRHEPLYQWARAVAMHFPGLSAPQARVLAQWSYGIVLTQSTAVTAVSGALAELLAKPRNTVRQRLREWYCEATAKTGTQRRDLAVETCFRPLLEWVLSLWQGTKLALALDATTLKDRFTILTVSVLIRGCAIPVAWVILPGNRPGAWRWHWLRLLRRLWCAVPPSWTVLVLADRGLYARWLFRRICRLGWHPLLRINRGGTFHPAGEAAGRSLKTFAPEPGTAWQGTGTAFKGKERQLHCTLLAYWAPEARQPWLILTDLLPYQAEANWYALRLWVEHGFKLLKSDGLRWQRSRMVDPDRAARLWLALALATLWLVSVGATAEVLEQTVPGTLPTIVTATAHRSVSVFRRGWQRLLASLLRHSYCPVARLYPEPWPKTLQLLM